MIGRLFPLSGLALVLWAFVLPAVARAGPEEWRREWPHTDFSRHSVAYEEILSGGPPKDGIPAIDHPSFVAVADARGLAPPEPMISVAIGGEARAYPLRVMIWHEIVNDTVGGTPIAVTWCPLCNSSVVFDRRAQPPVTPAPTGLARGPIAGRGVRSLQTSVAKDAAPDEPAE